MNILASWKDHPKKSGRNIYNVTRKPKYGLAERGRKLPRAMGPIKMLQVIRSNSYTEKDLRDHDYGQLRNTCVVDV